MGRDFEYLITKEKKVFSLVDSPVYMDDSKTMFTATIMDGGRNNWGGPDEYGKPYTKDDMIAALKEYVEECSGDEFEFCFTLRAFGQIISEMEADSFVFIFYG
jgi:hypothetical protein